jgi:hypothetical protein
VSLLGANEQVARKPAVLGLEAVKDIGPGVPMMPSSAQARRAKCLISAFVLNQLANRARRAGQAARWSQLKWICFA